MTDLLRGWSFVGLGILVIAAMVGLVEYKAAQQEPIDEPETETPAPEPILEPEEQADPEAPRAEEAAQTEPPPPTEAPIDPAPAEQATPEPQTAPPEDTSPQPETSQPEPQPEEPQEDTTPPDPQAEAEPPSEPPAPRPEPESTDDAATQPIDTPTPAILKDTPAQLFPIFENPDLLDNLKRDSDTLYSYPAGNEAVKLSTPAAAKVLRVYTLNDGAVGIYIQLSDTNLVLGIIGLEKATDGLAVDQELPGGTPLGTLKGHTTRFTATRITDPARWWEGQPIDPSSLLNTRP